MQSLTHIVLAGDSKCPQLSPQEVDALFSFAFRIHNHLASTPAVPMFWVRCEGASELFRFVT